MPTRFDGFSVKEDVYLAKLGKSFESFEGKNRNFDKTTNKSKRPGKAINKQYSLKSTSKLIIETLIDKDWDAVH